MAFSHFHIFTARPALIARGGASPLPLQFNPEGIGRAPLGDRGRA